VDTAHVTFRRQLVKIAPDRRLGDTERRTELLEPDRAARLDDHAQPLPAVGSEVASRGTLVQADLVNSHHERILTRVAVFLHILA
jgi:hypothetical protein